MKVDETVGGSGHSVRGSGGPEVRGSEGVARVRVIPSAVELPPCTSRHLPNLDPRSLA